MYIYIPIHIYIYTHIYIIEEIGLNLGNRIFKINTYTKKVKQIYGRLCRNAQITCIDFYFTPENHNEF